MAKIIKSIHIDESVAKEGIEAAKSERRSFSSFVENLIALYIKGNRKNKTKWNN